MTTVIHIEINVLFLIILSVIAWQITVSVSKQASRVLFRYVVYGIMWTLILDVLWILIDGKKFPGGIALNKIVNALFLGSAVTMGCLWYLYILEALECKISKTQARLIMIPGTLFFILNFISIWTGWIFYVTEDNVYVRGPMFPAQAIASMIMLIVSLIHLLILLFDPRKESIRPKVKKLLNYYSVPVFGTLLSMAYTGMPGTWTCAAVSVILIYMNDQDDAILRDSLTGLNNRKTLQPAFNSYVRQISDNNKLYLFIMDLDNFKTINDTLGHPTGDQALIEASQIILDTAGSRQGIVTRYGGDEFVIMGFFEDEPYAVSFADQMKQTFKRWNEEHERPYNLSTSIGYSRYHKDETLGELVSQADEKLYEDKRIRNKGR